MSKICRECSAELKDNAHFCPKCGASVDQKRDRPEQPNVIPSKADINQYQKRTQQKSHVSTNYSEITFMQRYKIPIIIIGVAVVLMIAFFIWQSVATKNSSTYSNNLNNTGNGGNITNTAPTTAQTTPTATVKTSRYEFVISDTTWSEAQKRCKSMGGHLATFETEDEWNSVIKTIKQKGYDNKKFYIGGSRAANSKEYRWLKEDGSYKGNSLNRSSHWIPEDPSYMDGDIEELCMMIYYYNKGGYWAWADVPDDVLSAAPDYKGKIGFICEYEN